MGGKVVSTGSGNSGFIDWDNGSVGVSNKTGIRSVSSGVGNWGSGGVNSSINSLGGKVVGTGGSDCWLVDWDNSSVGVGNEVGVQVEGTGIAIRSNNRGSSNSWCNSGDWSSGNNGSSGSVSNTLGGKMVSTGSSNGGLIKRNNSSVGVSNKLGVQVEGTSITVAGSITSIANRGSSNSWGNGGDRSGSNNGSSSSISSSFGNKMVSTGSGNSWLIKWDNSSVGVGHQLGVQVEGSSIAVVGSIDWGSVSSIAGNIRCSIAVSGSVATVASIAKSIPSPVTIASTVSSKIALGSQMIGSGSCYSRFINGSNCSIRMGLETIESLANREGYTSSKNQKLHICDCRVALKLKT